MKKIVYIIFLSMILILPVSAKENKLYFTGSEDRLYYKTDLYDEKVFMKHLDMIPGRSYEDKLVIENATKYDYKLYLRVKKRNQSKLADELLKNIKMVVLLDDEVLYEGLANGEDSSSSGVNLENSVYIGEYKAGSLGNLLVKTKLKEEYSNAENHELSYIDWEFVAEYDELVVPINPDTGANTNKYIKVIVISLSIMLLAILAFIFIIEKRKLVIKKL